ncbi:glycosyltransferase family 15 protein [Phaffia rhodozyma]|uniref:Glycosyltransferase family 15 protein n=1 Tax=Phaffia rhodozyma TaxID=264483 RepID=A0A0F7SXZ0_PHARH|nr:glycosyltransferase family 15 protein [Phaffia rhodozyma]
MAILFALPRPKVFLIIALSLLSFTLLLHPASPASYSRIYSYVPSKSSGYPPNLPDRIKGGFVNDTLGLGAIPDAGSWEDRRKANATFVVLARNSDLWDIIPSIQQMEDRFNWWAGYDWVFLNDQEFSEEFKKYTQQIVSTTAHYGLISPEEWNQPDWIDENKAAAARDDMFKHVSHSRCIPSSIHTLLLGTILMIFSISCRIERYLWRLRPLPKQYNSGFFYRHPLMMNYRYYWRVEPSVKFYCDIHYDPFLVLKDENKVYGFTLSLYEFTETIPTLWDATKEFMELHPEHIVEGNSMGFLSDDGGKEYNHCHFWSNFEIGDLDFWRGDAYMDYFNFLEAKGGFYYERWGDAPVHSIGAGLFAKKEQVHFFSDIGYYHGPYSHCPTGEAHSAGRCSCKEEDNFDEHWFSCTKKYKAQFPNEKFFGSEA